jgi:hypothetical protein
MTIEDDEKVQGCNWQGEFPHISSINYHSPTKWNIANVNAKIKGQQVKLTLKRNIANKKTKSGRKSTMNGQMKIRAHFAFQLLPIKLVLPINPFLLTKKGYLA